jgi:hypothetical protein
MILAHFLAATLVIGVNAGPMDDSFVSRRLSMQQRHAAAQVYVRSATFCVARVVAADKRLSRSDPASGLLHLIEDSIPKCLLPMRAMIDAYDLYFGVGTGEQFFTGPFLDALPGSVGKIIAESPD